MTRIEAALAAARRWQSGPPPDEALVAIAELRALRDEPEHRTAVAGTLGDLLARKALHGSDLAELDEAEAELTLALTQDSTRRDHRHNLAVVRVLRYTQHAGPDEDFTSAHAALTGLLEIPGYAEESGDLARALLVQLLTLSLQPRETRRPADQLDAAARELVMRNSFLVTSEQKAAVAQEVIALLDSMSETNRSHPQVLSHKLMISLMTVSDRAGYDDALARIDQQMADADNVERALLATMRAGVQADIAALSHHPADAIAAAEAAEAATAAMTADVPMAEQFRDALSALKYPNDLRAPLSAAELPEELARLERTLERFPRDHPARENTLEFFVIGIGTRIAASKSADDAVDRLRAFYLAATATGPDDAMCHLITALLDVLKGMLTDDPTELSSAVRTAERAAERFPDDGVIQTLMKVFTAAALAKRSVDAWNLQDIESAFQALHSGDAHPDPLAEGLLAWGRACVGIASFQHRSPDEAQVAAVIGEFGRVPGQLRDYSHVDVDALARNVLQMQAYLSSAESGQPLLPDFVPVADRVHWSARDRDLVEGLVLAYNGLGKGDLDAVDRGLALLLRYENDETTNRRDAVAIAWSTGTTEFFRHLISHHQDDLDNAITHLEKAVAQVEREPGLANVSEVYYRLGAALDLRAGQTDRVRAAENGVLSLRARTTDVLLQADVGHALIMAEHAKDEAVTVVRWCLAAERSDLAVQALELGRSLVLHSISAEASITDLLRDAGRPDLAAEWDAVTGESATAELRYRVLTAMAGSKAGSQLLRPPSAEHIREALRHTGNDALVYLLPTAPHAPGLAFVVPADGDVEHLPLPDLRTEPAAAFQEARRTLLDPSAADERRWTETVASTCDWAWQAVMGALLDRFRGLPRLVLVPVGELGAVPWHAARRGHRGAVRYACQDAVITYAASARQFTDAASRTRRPADEDVALIRVRDGELAWAATEIRTVRDHNYPNATTVETDVRPADVLSHLPSATAPGASVLHLTCHTRYETPAVDSHLLLDNGEVLPMRAVLRQARHRGQDADGGLVVLASCASDLTDTAHDEALTLATAFLAAGATGAVGARWPIVDLATTFFVTMFHHYLTRGSRDPAVALRATQVWMLDPGREVPPDLDPKLARLARFVRLDAPGHWAAFTYQGR